MGCGGSKSEQGSPDQPEAPAAQSPPRQINDDLEALEQSGPRKRRNSFTAVETKEQMEPENKMPISQLKVGFHSNKGYKPSGRGQTESINQDRGVIAFPLSNSERQMFLGVFDGHGKHGEKVSEFSAFTMLAEFEDGRVAGESVEDGMHRASIQTEKKLREAMPVVAEKSGTTAIAAVLSPDRITVTCIGDSRCVLGRRKKSGEGWDAVPLSIDQTGALKEEANRVMKAGGRIYTDKEIGITKVVHPAGYALGMSRSLGDWVFDAVGVTGDPVVTETALGDDDACVIVASDGLWEFVESQEAIDMAQQNSHSAEEACRKLITHAAALWLKNEGDYRDDITVIVAFLKDLFPEGSATAEPTAAAPAAAANRSVVLDTSGDHMTAQRPPQVERATSEETVDPDEPIEESPQRTRARRLSFHANQDAAQALAATSQPS